MADVLLLSLDASTALTDASSSPLTFTAYGGAALSTAQSQYGGSSLYLDGAGDYIKAASSSNTILGADDFTIEFWVRPNTPVQSYPTVIANGVFTGANIWAVQLGRTGVGLKVQLWVYNYSSGAAMLTGATTLSTTAFTHVAITRSGNVFTIWVNGVSDGTVTNSVNLCAAASETITIGGDSAGTTSTCFAGYVDDIRITKGTARYTGTFDLPLAINTTGAFGKTVTNLFTLYPGEAMALGTFYAGYKYGEHTTWSLSCNDEPSSPYATEDVGDPAFDPTGAIYLTFGTVNSATVKKHGSASLFFPASAYVLLPTGAAVIPAYGEFTLEFWINVGSVTPNTVIIWGGATSNDPSVYMTGNSFTTRIATSPTITYGQWNHYAMCRKANIMRHYLNGVKFAEALSLGAMTITQLGHGVAATVYLDSIGFANGYAYYDGNDFSIPNTPFYNVPSSQGVRMQWNYSLVPAEASGSVITPAQADGQWGKTSLLIRGAGVDGSSLISEAKGRYLTAQNVITSAAHSKHLDTSLYFNGTNSIIQIPLARSLDFFDGTDFTIEFWMYPTRLQQSAILDKWGDIRKSYAVYLMADGSIQFSFQDAPTGTTTTVTSPATILPNYWWFVSVCKYGNDYLVSVNGVGGTIVTTTKLPRQDSDRMYAGGGYGGDVRSWDGDLVMGASGPSTAYPGYYYQGYIEDFRITNGYSRYQNLALYPTPTSNFLPSGGGAQGDAFWGNVVFLAHFDEPHGTVANIRDALGHVITIVGNGYVNNGGIFGNCLVMTSYAYMQVLYGAEFDFTTGDFTIEFYTTSIASAAVSNYYGMGSRGFSFNCIGGLNPADSRYGGYMQWTQWNESGVQDIALSNLYAFAGERQNRWFHIALVRKGNDITIYIDGVGNTTTNITRRPAAVTGPIYFMGPPGTGKGTPVNMDELRITRAARYTTNFKVPTSPYSEQSFSTGAAVLGYFHEFLPGSVRIAATGHGAIVSSEYSVVPPLIVGKPKVEGITFDGNGYSIVTETDAAIGGEGIPEALAFLDDIFACLAFSHSHTMAFGDLVSAQAVRNIASSLSFGATASAMLKSVQLNDGFTFTSTVPPIRLTVPMLETVELTSNAVPALGVILAAQIGMADAPIVARGQVLSEVISLSMPVGPTSHRLMASDNLVMADTAAQAAHGVAADTLVLAETTATKASFTSSLTDAVAFNDAPSLALVLSATVSDDIALNDIPAQQLLFSVIMQDGMQFSTLFTSPVVTAWAMNMRNAAVTQYSNFQYNSFAKMGERYLGANDQGLWWMDGTLDGIRPVNSRITTGILQPNGNKLAGVLYAYLGIRGNGQFVITVTDEAGGSYNYTLNAVDMETSRVVFGRGFRTRYFTFSLESRGQDFDMDNIEFVTSDTTRKLQR